MVTLVRSHGDGHSSVLSSVPRIHSHCAVGHGRDIHGVSGCAGSAAADTAANQHIHLHPRQEACQCAVAAAGRVHNLGRLNLIVLYRIKFKILTMAEMLEDLAVLISYRNFHRKTSKSVFLNDIIRLFLTYVNNETKNL